MARQPKIEALLEDLCKEELIHIIAKAAKQNKVFKDELLAKYTKGDPLKQLKAYKKLVTSIVKSYTGREGFIPFRKTFNFANDMLGILDKARSLEDDFIRLEIALMVLEEGVEALQYADDSNGDIGLLVESTLEQVEEISSEFNQAGGPAHEQMFERLLQMSQSPVLNGWDDFRIRLLDICASNAVTEKLRERIRQSIESQIISNNRSEYMQYTNEALYKILFQLLLEHGSRQEAEEFVQEHLHFSFFRAWAIEESMDKGDFQHALQLAEEGQRQDSHLPGLVSQWKRAAYAAYKKLSLTKEQAILAKELLLNGDYTYYDELESLYEGDKEAFYRSILPELRETKNFRTRQVYLRLIEYKNDTAEIMAFVKNNPYVIEEYASLLFAAYPEEVKQLYSQQILQSASASSNRKQYRKVCQMLKHYRKIAGKGSLSTMITELKTQYNQRPAFLDELSKID